jgi:hypothetical protein
LPQLRKRVRRRIKEKKRKRKKEKGVILILIRLEPKHPLASISKSYNQNNFYIAYHAALCASIEQFGQDKRPA